MSPRRPKQNEAAQTAALNRQGIERWRHAGPLLEARRIAELKAMTAAERREAIQAVMELARTDPPTRTTSGLVDYYRKLRT